VLRTEEYLYAVVAKGIWGGAQPDAEEYVPDYLYDFEKRSAAAFGCKKMNQSMHR